MDNFIKRVAIFSQMRLCFTPVENHGDVEGYKLYITDAHRELKRLSDGTVPFSSGYHLGKPEIDSSDNFCEVDLSLLPGIGKLKGAYNFGLCAVTSDGTECEFHEILYAPIGFTLQRGCMECEYYNFARSFGVEIEA
jgi:hypothetical protein